ncbi:hypothetical protein ACSBR2_041867 [Camellia fascicularis]
MYSLVNNTNQEADFFHGLQHPPFIRENSPRNLKMPKKSIASLGRGILAIDESNATCGKRLSSIGLDNTEVNRQAYRQLLLTTPSLGEYISGVILFEETLYQSTIDGKKFVDCLREQNIVPGIKVDKGLVPLPGSNNESWCRGLDGLASRSAEYYKQGARFAKWCTVVSIPCGPSALVVKEAAWGLARYAGISQDNGLVPIVEPDILLDGRAPYWEDTRGGGACLGRSLYYLAENNVMFEGILLKPSLVTPGAKHKEKASPETISKHTLTMLKRRVPPSVPGIMSKYGQLVPLGLLVGQQRNHEAVEKLPWIILA